MLDTSNSIEDHLRQLGETFPTQALESLHNYFRNHMVHLTRDRGEIVPQAEYMNLLQKWAPICYSFLGCSRMSARELLEGQYGGLRWPFLTRRVPAFFRFFFRRALPIIAACVGILAVTYQYRFNLALSNLLFQILAFSAAICVFYWLRYEWKDNKDVNAKRQAERGRARQIYLRFKHYNELLSQRKNSKFPATRIFVLEGDQIEKDKERVPRGGGKTWWDIMEEEHKKYNVEIALVCLTTDIKSTHPDLEHQFSLFVVPDEGGWVVVRKESLGPAARVSCQGRDAFHSYTTLCSDLEAVAERTLDISRCVRCSRGGRDLCYRKECPKWKPFPNGDTVNTNSAGRV